MGHFFPLSDHGVVAGLGQPPGSPGLFVWAEVVPLLLAHEGHGVGLVRLLVSRGQGVVIFLFLLILGRLVGEVGLGLVPDGLLLGHLQPVLFNFGDLVLVQGLQVVVVVLLIVLVVGLLSKVIWPVNMVSLAL